MKLIEAYPEFIDIYREIAEFRRDMILSISINNRLTNGLP